jgi:hypothetical protein
MGSFGKKKPSQFSSLLWRLPKAYAWSAFVLVDELGARGFESAADGDLVSTVAQVVEAAFAAKLSKLTCFDEPVRIVKSKDEKKSGHRPKPRPSERGSNESPSSANRCASVIEII